MTVKILSEWYLKNHSIATLVLRSVKFALKEVLNSLHLPEVLTFLKISALNAESKILKEISLRI